MKTDINASFGSQVQGLDGEQVEVEIREKKAGVKTVLLDLMPGFRERLIEKLNAVHVPEEARLAHLSALTGRVPQTARRWIDPLKPGLPDLESFVLLCMGLDSDAHSLLGLQPPRRASLQGLQPGGDIANPAARIKTIVRGFADDVAGCETMQMEGDDMDPAIRDGDMMLVDCRHPDIGGNGIYVLEYERRIMVRNVESRIGEGLVLGCENPKYKECIIKDLAAARRIGLKIIGKVKASIGITKFWN